MATPVINAPSGMIRHTKVDFALRETFEPVHAVQGDAVLPVIAVAMYLNSEPYVLPDGATVNIRLDKKDKHYCYNEALGCDSTRTTVYFRVSKQMASTPGELSPEIEVVSGAGIAGSSRFPFIVDRSNINEDLIESTTEGQTIIMYAQQATESATAAKASAQAAATSEANAKTDADRAESAQAAIQQIQDTASASAQAAALSETNAKSSETAAALSETNAKASETAVAASEANAKKSETAAAASESNAKTSEDNSKNYMELSHSYMDGGGESGREGEATDNAKYYSEQAKAYADKAEAATNVGIATPDKAGLVKPDGTSIKVDSDGTISANATAYALAEDVGNVGDLTTDDKSSAVAAINEINAYMRKLVSFRYDEEKRQAISMLPMDYTDGKLTIPGSLGSDSKTDEHTVILA